MVVLWIIVHKMNRDLRHPFFYLSDRTRVNSADCIWIAAAIWSTPSLYISRESRFIFKYCNFTICENGWNNLCAERSSNKSQLHGNIETIFQLKLNNKSTSIGCRRNWMD